MSGTGSQDDSSRPSTKGVHRVGTTYVLVRTAVPYKPVSFWQVWPLTGYIRLHTNVFIPPYLLEHGQNLSRRHNREVDEADKLREQPGDVIADEVGQLSSELHPRRTCPNNLREGSCGTKPIVEADMNMSCIEIQGKIIKHKRSCWPMGRDRRHLTQECKQ